MQEPRITAMLLCRRTARQRTSAFTVLGPGPTLTDLLFFFLSQQSEWACLSLFLYSCFFPGHLLLSFQGSVSLVPGLDTIRCKSEK